MRLTAASHERFATPPLRSPGLAVVLVIGALGAVFGLDRSTGATPVQHLYYVPIILAGFRFRLKGALITGISAIVLYHLANPHLLTFKYEESDLVQMALFLAIGTITAKLTRDAERLQRLAMTDDLTGLHNLRSFEAHLATIVRSARESRTPLALLVLDVDRLKSLNDRFGHVTGAEAVRTVGHILGDKLPPEATACRYGGDEFVVAIPGSQSYDVQGVADDLCQAVRECAPVLAGRPFAAGTLSISVGIASATFDRNPAHAVGRHDAEAGELLFRTADAALYRAKARGRDQVCVA